MGKNDYSKSVDIAPLERSHSSVTLILFESEIRSCADTDENSNHLKYDTDPIDDKSLSSTDTAPY